jgi:glycosyltransferase involved in cell wall biosynthesis
MKVYSIHKFKNSKLNTIYFFIKSFFKIAHIHKKKPIDVINIHSFHYNLIPPLFIQILFKIPILIKMPMDFITAYREESRFISKLFFYSWMKFFTKFIIYRKKIFIQAVNEKIYDDLHALSFPKEDILKLPNGISSKNYLEIKKLGSKETHFGYVGRLIKSKNLRFLLKTYSKYKLKYPKDKLFIYGKGPEEEFITKFITDNNLEKHIVFSGFEKDKAIIYANIDVFIHPSLGEGSPNTILEAMCTNTFVIASDVSGNQDIINHKIDGLLFNPYKERDLLGQLQFFKEHQELIPQMLENARNKVITNYDINIVANKIFNFLSFKFLKP